VNHQTSLAPSTKTEAELVQEINESRSLSQIQWQRYANLNEKMLAEDLSPSEYAELGDLIAQIETFDAERIALLVELAQLRRIDLDDLITDLGLTHPK
jgi:hypothetical protein